MTWRPHPLVLGAVYMVPASINTHAGSFSHGQQYRFVNTEYSLYDSSTIFTFEVVGTELFVGWWWHDDEPDSLPSVRFCRIS